MRISLEARGFAVEESTDGKGAPDLIRRLRPDCVVLAVDLDAGQNGYFVCKKLKGDDDLKAVPVIIIGDPTGFAKHQQLKTRADGYVGKPLDAEALVEQVGGLVGFPVIEVPPAAEETFDASLMVEETPGESVEVFSTEGPLEVPPELNSSEGDPDFEMVDAMFEDKPSPSADDEISISSAIEGDDTSTEHTVVGLNALELRVVPPIDEPPRAPFYSSPSSTFDPESRELRSKVTELSAALDDAHGRIAELENKVRDVELNLEEKETQLQTARAAPGKGDSKEVFALRDSLNKKDKEIVRLKNELNSREQEMVELREKENSLEQKASESTGEIARRDAQVKSLQNKADQLSLDRRRIDQQLNHAKEEARSASAKLSTLQSDYDAMQSRLAELEQQVAAQSQEQETLRAQLEQAQSDADSARGQLTSQATSFADEISDLRQRLSDTEGEATRHGERAARYQARLKGHQAQLDQLRQSLSQALGSIDPAASEGEELEIDDLAEA